VVRLHALCLMVQGWEVWGSGFRVLGAAARRVGIRDEGLGFSGWALCCLVDVSLFRALVRFWVSVLGFRVSGFGFRVSGFGFRFSVFGVGFRVSGFGFRVSGFGFRIVGGGYVGQPQKPSPPSTITFFLPSVPIKSRSMYYIYIYIHTYIYI